jgi:glycosyltransferase involved in cell wall biosynthesis
MQKLKIAVWHNLPSGGGKRALFHHVKGLVERGHTVESWCPPTADQTYLPLGDLIKESIVPLAETQPKAGRIANLLSPYQTMVDKIQAMDIHCQQCAEEINKGDFDVLFANACTFFRTTSIARYVNIPKLLYLQEPYRWLYEALPKLPWLALPPFDKPWWTSRSYSLAFLRNQIEVQGFRVQAREELLNAEAFDLILVNSLFSRESVQRAYGIDSKVCYLGVDAELFKPLNLPRQKSVVGLGSIYIGKGLERAVNAVATIEKKDRPSLVWIGNFSDLSYQNEIIKLATSMGVEFIPKVRVSDDEVVKLLNEASVMLYTPILEPFGFAPLEANACGTPVVAIAEGGIRETIKDGINGFLINGNEPVEMGKAISKILNNKELADNMGKNARSYVLEQWSWERGIDRLEKCILNLLCQKA